MNLDKVIKSGNEVRIKSDYGYFTTIVDEVMGNDTFSILGPIDREQKRMVKLGDKYYVSCFTETGMFVFEAVIRELDSSFNRAIIQLKSTGPYTKIQRREAFRAKEHIDVNARKRADEAALAKRWLKTNSVDISETGMLLRYDEDCPIGQEVELIIRVNRFGINEVLPNIKGKVVRCIQTRNKDYEYLLGLKFESLPEKTRNVIIKLVVLSQRNKLRYKHVKEYGKYGDRGHSKH